MLIADLYNPIVFTVEDNATVKETLDTFLKKHVNGLVVVSHKNPKKVVGVVSLQDMAAAVLPQQFQDNNRIAMAMYKKGFFTNQCQELKSKKVSSIMRKDFTDVNLKDNIMAVMADFLENDLYIVPVIEKNKLIGIINRGQIRDALEYGMRELK
ncbi:MAG: CBS domain-containing protein [Pseudomonadales bacterium]|nr:CBS domain-containing protein [Candidatus Woesebacteria bacterium]MCB9801786.1 CBS domain-containing protein [Pseudomonadales bacterium]